MIKPTDPNLLLGARISTQNRSGSIVSIGAVTGDPYVLFEHDTIIRPFPWDALTLIETEKLTELRRLLYVKNLTETQIVNAIFVVNLVTYKNLADHHEEIDSFSTLEEAKQFVDNWVVDRKNCTELQVISQRLEPVVYYRGLCSDDDDDD